jgi:hypothetical protein
MLIRLYRLLLHLFPARYRETFGQEMVSVFQQAHAEARARGGVSLTVFCIREFGGLLGAAFRAHAWRPDSEEQALATNPPARAFDGVPCFYSCEDYFPRQSALFHGGILSLVLFSAVSAAFEYGVGHHAFRVQAGASREAAQSQTITSTDSGFVAFGRSMMASANSVLVMILDARPGTGERETRGTQPEGVWSNLVWLVKVRSHFPRPGDVVQFMSGVRGDPPMGAVRLPDTPAARRFGAWLRLYNSGNSNQLKSFYTENFENASAEPAEAENNAAVWVELLGRFGTYELRTVEQSSPYALVVLCQTNQTGYWVRLRMQLSTQEPHKIVAFPYRSFGNQRPSASETDLFQPADHVAGQQPPAARPPGTHSMQLPLWRLQAYVGTYESEGQDPLTSIVSLKGGQLYIEVNGQPPTPLFAQSETRFFPSGLTNRWVEFVPSESTGLQLVIQQSGREYRARRKRR